MTGLTLTKHHGLGNDFLVLFADDGDAADLPALARRLCHRTRGIGADGLLVGSPEDGFDARMVLYNADGSRAEMSGNGIRCFAQAVAGRRGDLAAQRILTDAGPRTVELAPTEDPYTIMAAVDMGEVADLPAARRLGRHRRQPRSARRPPRARQPAHGRRRRRRARPSTCGRSARASRTSTSRSSSPARSATPSRCASTSAAPASPRRAARAPRRPRGPRPGGASSTPASTELLVHMDGGSAKVTLHRPGRHATGRHVVDALTGPGHATSRGPIERRLRVSDHEQPVQRGARARRSSSARSASASSSSA